VDLKADRANGCLLVPGAFSEARVADDRRDMARVADCLADEVTLMAQWLGLPRVEVGSRGDLAAPLVRALRQRRTTAQ
jgi:uncharacterized protein